MSITLTNPAGIPQVDLYHHVAVATGSRQVFLAGQVSWDADGATVGVGDLAAQVEQSLLNVATALAAVGGTLADVVKFTVYLVDWTPDKMAAYVEGVARAADRLGVPVPQAPLTGIGVAALAGPELLVEIDATAILD
ncbi:RidA family protein [Patulibacter americanus]|uniref:RidA family protein n=1 Tax=Patulibacter americanus TaxID=588672 RepID=UPI0003B5ABA5|nr:RidA family protein [Patulibacter americanus]